MGEVLERKIDERIRLDAEALEDGLVDLVTSASKLGISLKDKVIDPSSTDFAIRSCLKYLGVEAGTVPDSVTRMEDRIEWLCRPSGTMYRTVRLDDGWSDRAYGVLLGQLDTGDPIALMPRSLHGYYYIDAKTGQRVKLDSDTARHIGREAVAFYKPLPTKRLGPIDLVKFVMSNFDRADYTMVVITCAAVTLIGLLPALANLLAFDIVVPSGDISLIMPIAALLVGVAIARGLFSVCRSILTARIATKIDTTTEAATFARLLTLPTGFFKQYSSGDLASRVSCMRNITQAITVALLGTSLTAVLSLAYAFEIGAFAPSLMVPALVVIAIQVALSAVVVFGSMPYEQASLEEGARLSSLVTSLISGIQKLKLAGAEDRALARWSHAYAAYARVTYNRPLVLRVMPALVLATGLVGTIVFYGIAVASQISVADYMAFSVAYGQATAAIMGLSKVAGHIATIRPNYRMVSPILEAEPEVAQGRDGVDELDGSLAMENVSFRYDEESPYVLDNLSLQVQTGEYVAVVGKSGCGKSTLVRLLLGFEQPEHGSINYGKYEVSKVDLRSLRQQIGLVMQNGKLFSDDIFANITVSTPQATLDDAWEAAELACVADDIRKMPMGMRTMVSEGSGGISGGQRQRILIARAVCGGRKILIFDEATSALDNVTQRRVSEALDNLGCTRIVIAHRLSTVRNCDRILVLDGGRVAEEGTYEELLDQGGLFADLVAKQLLDTRPTSKAAQS